MFNGKILVADCVLGKSRFGFQLQQNENTRVRRFSESSVRLDHICRNNVKGIDYIRNNQLNKGLAFPIYERQVLGLNGLLPHQYRTKEEQLEVIKFEYARYSKPLNQYVYLNNLRDHNERLFYNFINTDVEKFLPIVYTPTVGLACQTFGMLYKKIKGLFINALDRGRIAEIVANWPVEDVRAVCVTDGERILGLGDLGAYGMGISVGKLCLYTALAGVKPHQCLPVTLDVGTNNMSLLTDPTYIGIRQKRIVGDEYLSFLDEFMEACTRRYGKKLLIQFEDFALKNAPPLLSRYRDKYCVFNDDIQGTASVVVAGVLAGVRLSNKKVMDNTFLFLGAGSAGIGIADLLVDAMVEEGLPKKKAQDKIVLFDIDGLLTTKRDSGVPPHASHYGKDLPPNKDFEGAVRDLKPTCLIGVSTVAGAFTPTILQQMAKNVDRPMIFALSNPTPKSECTAQQAYDNTEGRCIFSSGSPFPPTTYKGKTYHTGQGNNSYIFPGVALGIIACRMSKVSDHIFLTAAKTLAYMVQDKDFEDGRLYPSLSDIRCISLRIAVAVIEEAYKTGVAGVLPKPDNIEEFVLKHVYNLDYPSYVPKCYDYPELKEFKVKSFKEVADSFNRDKGLLWLF